MIVPPAGINRVDAASARSAVMAAASFTCQVTVHCCGPAASAVTRVWAGAVEVAAAFRPMYTPVTSATGSVINCGSPS